jgi:hypothetical protein
MNWLGIKVMCNGNGKVSGIDRRFGRNVQYSPLSISSLVAGIVHSILVEGPRPIAHT